MSLIDAKFIGLVSSRLVKFKKIKEGVYTFRCPFCGDSQRNKNKTRGYLYKLKNDHNFKCHNCGKSSSFTNFLKEIDVTIHDQYVFERYKNGSVGKGSNTPVPEFNIKKPSFAKKDFNLPTIQELNKEHVARKFLEDRQIPEKYFSELYFTEYFKEWTNTQKHTFNNTSNDEPRIIIPLKKDNVIFGFQGRSLNPKSKAKYITIILDESYPKIYGLDKVDWSKNIYVVEGPFDSMFLENAIAMVGADVDWGFINSHQEIDFIFVYDNEKRNKEIVGRMQKVIDRDQFIVIWPDTIREKDINDMYMSGHEVQNIVQSNVYSGLQAKAKLTGWKKT